MTCESEGVRFSWLDGPQGITSLAQEWEELFQALQSEIYLSPDWLDIWWSHFNNGRILKIFVARDVSGKLIGVLPFCIETVGLGPLGLRVARFAGTDPYTLVLKLPVLPENVDQVLKQALEELLVHQQAADAVSFTPVSTQSQLWSAIEHVDQGAVANLRLRNRPYGVHMMFELPDSRDSYFARLSKKRRSQVRRDLRNLQKDFGMTSEKTHPRRREFEDFAEFHNAQWQAVGKGGHFVDWPGSIDFYRDISERFHSKENVWLMHMNAKSKRMSSQFCLVTGQTCHWRLPARSTDPDFESTSLGKLGLVLMIEELIEAGVTKVEAGMGKYDYKKVFGAVEVPCYQSIVGSERLKVRIGLPLMLIWAKLLNRVYYRLWFGRIFPWLSGKFNLKPKPLWNLWIRSRV